MVYVTTVAVSRGARPVFIFPFQMLSKKTFVTCIFSFPPTAAELLVLHKENNIHDYATQPHMFLCTHHNLKGESSLTFGWFDNNESCLSYMNWWRLDAFSPGPLSLLCINSRCCVMIRREDRLSPPPSKILDRMCNILMKETRESVGNL